MVLTLVIPQNFPYVLAGLAAHFLVCQIMAPTIARPARIAAFGGDFLKQFADEHSKAFPGKTIDAGG